jgi:hypothetical protein
MFEHLGLRKIGYRQHFYYASVMGFKFLMASISSFIHAVFPDLLPFTAQRIAAEVVQGEQQFNSKGDGTNGHD